MNRKTTVIGVCMAILACASCERTGDPAKATRPKQIYSDYKIVDMSIPNYSEKESIKEFEKACSDLIRDGWTPAGGVNATATDPHLSIRKFSQAFYR
jgi:hypothetical protein